MGMGVRQALTVCHEDDSGHHTACGAEHTSKGYVVYCLNANQHTANTFLRKSLCKLLKNVQVTFPTFSLSPRLQYWGVVNLCTTILCGLQDPRKTCCVPARTGRLCMCTQAKAIGRADTGCTYAQCADPQQFWNSTRCFPTLETKHVLY